MKGIALFVPVFIRFLLYLYIQQGFPDNLIKGIRKSRILPCSRRNTAETKSEEVASQWKSCHIPTSGDF